jgi:hypothetical protein
MSKYSKDSASKKRKKVVKLIEKRAIIVLGEDILMERVLQMEGKYLTRRLFGKNHLE